MGVCYVFAAICFAIAVILAFVPSNGFLNRVPWVPLGLFFWVLPAALGVIGVR